MRIGDIGGEGLYEGGYGEILGLIIFLFFVVLFSGVLGLLGGYWGLGFRVLVF